jgi:hypothetical protein
MRWWWLPLILLVIGLIWWQYGGRPDRQKPTTASSQGSPEPAGKRQQASVDTPAEKKVEKKEAADTPTSPVRSIAEFERRFPGSWRFRRKANESIQTITGGLIAEAGQSPETALNLARQISPILAAGEYSLENESRQPAAQERLSTYVVRQTAGGFAVYQGSLEMLARNADGAVYIINNRLREITAFDPIPQITVEQGLQVIRQKYGDGDVSSPGAPQVFAIKGQKSQLAWIYGVTQTRPHASQKAVVVSAADGRILYEEEHLIHD